MGTASRTPNWNSWAFHSLWMILLIKHVSGHITLYGIERRSKQVCVQPLTERDLLSHGKEPEKLCEKLLNITSNSSHIVDGELYTDNMNTTKQTINLTEVCAAGDKMALCSFAESNRSSACRYLKVCCAYIAQIELDSIYADCPRIFASDIDQRACGGRKPVTFHHSQFAIGELKTSMSKNPNIFYWTASYIKRMRRGDEENNLPVVPRANSTERDKRDCVFFCLNGVTNPKVAYIAYNRTKVSCHCFAREKGGNPIGTFDIIYIIKDRVGDTKGLKGNDVCIAAVMKNGSVEFQVKSCMNSYSILCGPERCSNRGTGYKCDYTGENTLAIPPGTTMHDTSSASQTTMSVTEDTISSNPEKGFSTTSMVIIVAVPMLLFISGSVFLITFTKRKYCKKKPMERGRPNSMSNRTYHMQNPIPEDDEDVYTTITETTDVFPEMGRPLLPPRNTDQANGIQDVIFKTEYSSPLDNIVSEANEYTETYDNPMRKTVSKSKVTKKSKGQPQAEQSDGIAMKTTKLIREECAGNKMRQTGTYSETSLVSNERCRGLFDIRGVIRRSIVDHGKVHTLSVEPDEQNKTNPNDYFLLSKCNDAVFAVSQETSFDKDKYNNHNIDDYEDTSIIDGNLVESLIDTPDKPMPESRVNGTANTDEESLMCRISPFLLKKLKIKIIPDDNEYATRYKNWPRRSSNENVVISNNVHNTLTQLDGKDIITEPIDNEYDKLCYVKRAVSDGRERRNAYYHVQMKNGGNGSRNRKRCSSV